MLCVLIRCEYPGNHNSFHFSATALKSGGKLSSALCVLPSLRPDTNMCSNNTASPSVTHISHCLCCVCVCADRSHTHTHTLMHNMRPEETCMCAGCCVLIVYLKSWFVVKVSYIDAVGWKVQVCVFVLLAKYLVTH